MLGVFLASEEGARHNRGAKHGRPMDWILRAGELGDEEALHEAVRWLLRPVVPVERYEVAVKLLKRAGKRRDGWAARVLKGVEEWGFESRVLVGWAAGRSWGDSEEVVGHHCACRA
jgi:hypothetical protein